MFGCLQNTQITRRKFTRHFIFTKKSPMLEYNTVNLSALVILPEECINIHSFINVSFENKESQKISQSNMKNPTIIEI